MSIALITVPYTSTGLANGEARAPAVLRGAGLLDALRSAGASLTDLGDITYSLQAPERDPGSGVIAPGALLAMVRETRLVVAEALNRSLFPAVVGGECPLLLGCLAAARDAHSRIGLLFADGHEDAWPPHASTTGEAADMELGLALGRTRLTDLSELEAILPLVDPADAVLLGPRDRQEIRDAGIATLDEATLLVNDADLRQGDIAHQGRSSAQRVQRSAGNWWFHLDFDVLSSAALPAVRYPQPGGLSWDQLARLSQAAMEVPGLIGLDLTIYNPDLDPSGKGAARIVEFVASLAPSIPASGSLRAGMT